MALNPHNLWGGKKRTVLKGAENVSFWSSSDFICMIVAKSFYYAMYYSYQCYMGIITPSLSKGMKAGCVASVLGTRAEVSKRPPQVR